MAKATIDKTAHIAPDVLLGENVVISPRVSVGSGTIIGNGVVIHADTVIGQNVTIYDNAVLGRKPQGVGALTRRIREELSALIIEDDCVIGACAVLYRGTVIGRCTLIGDLASIREECHVGNDVIIARGVTVNYNTRIGSKTKIMDNTHITGDMVIEEGVFISPLVVTTNDNTMDRDPRGPLQRGGPYIKKGASVGAGASLLPKVVVGEYAVVASGAVVHLDVPPCKIVAGVPARVVKDVPPEWLPSGEKGGKVTEDV